MKQNASSINTQEFCHELDNAFLVVLCILGFSNGSTDGQTTAPNMTTRCHDNVCYGFDPRDLARR